MCRDWSVEASGGHGNDPRTASNHGAARDGLGVNPSDVIISRVFAPLSRALVGRGGAREVLGWTAVAQCPTLSAKYFSVSLKISICGLTNMAKSTTLPAFRQPVQWWPK